MIGYHGDTIDYGRDEGRDDVAILRALVEKGAKLERIRAIRGSWEEQRVVVFMQQVWLDCSG